MRNSPSNCSFLLILSIALWCGPPAAQSRPQATSPANAPSASADRVVLTFGDQKMSAADVDKFVRHLSPQLRAYFASRQGRESLAQQLINMKVLLAEAAKMKLAEEPDVAYILKIDQESILEEAASERIERSVSVSEEELQELYKKEQNQFVQAHIRRLLIRTASAGLKPPGTGHPLLSEAEARQKIEDIRKQILAGADFAQMAKRYSEDANSAPNGGDMGFVSHDQVMPPLGDVAAALKVGEVSPVVGTPMGLELIKVEEKRSKPFAEVKPQLESELRQAKGKEAIQHLAEQYKIVIDKGYFSSQEPTPPAPPASPGQH